MFAPRKTKRSLLKNETLLGISQSGIRERHPYRC